MHIPYTLTYFYQYYCRCVNKVYAEINTFPPPFSKNAVHSDDPLENFQYYNVNIQFKWSKFLWNIRQ